MTFQTARLLLMCVLNVYPCHHSDMSSLVDINVYVKKLVLSFEM